MSKKYPIKQRDFNVNCTDASEHRTNWIAPYTTGLTVIVKQEADITLFRACTVASENNLLCCDGDHRLRVSSRNIVHDPLNLTEFQFRKFFKSSNDRLPAFNTRWCNTPFPQCYSANQTIPESHCMYLFYSSFVAEIPE